MIDYYPTLISGLKTKTNLPVLYEQISTNQSYPLITVYQVSSMGNTRYDLFNQYATKDIVSFQVTIYSNDLSVIQTQSQNVCEYMNDNMWRKTGCIEMVNNETGIIRKIFTFQKYE